MKDERIIADGWEKYLDKINTLSISGNIGKHSDHADLENAVIEILADSNKFNFNLSALFQELTNGQQKESREEITLNPEIINQVSECLGLQFINKKETEGNVCFINSNELRPEFRQSFTSIDLLDYCYAVLHSALNEFSEINSARISITSDSSIFWELVKYGSELRKKNSLK